VSANDKGWLDASLTPIERALRGEPVDRPAAITPTSVVNVELMDYSESPFPEAHRDLVKMTTLAETGHTVLGYDTIMPVFTII
jgi:[methyl-Co(III) methanol-specific corrinoid protein]:coenzyme M methyltransferase